MMLTMGAGSFLISINKSLATQKTYKLEFIKRKPPVKKNEIRKEIVRQKIKVPVLPKALPVVKQKTAPQPKTSVAKSYKKVVHQEIKIARLQPKSLPTTQPKMTVRQSAVMHTSSATTSRRVTTKIPTARSFATVSKKSTKGTTRMAMVQGANHSIVHKLPKLVARSSGSTAKSKSSNSRITPVLTGMQHASLSLKSSPREVPNIIDRGALKGYIGQIQRLIENAKRYPEVSRKAGREGKVKVQFTIFRNGKVGNIKLVTRTPYPKLNQEAMDAVERAAPFSGFPDSLGKKSVSVILPFRFELR